MRRVTLHIGASHLCSYVYCQARRSRSAEANQCSTGYEGPNCGQCVFGYFNAAWNEVCWVSWK